jgi:hypothetical protein
VNVEFGKSPEQDATRTGNSRASTVAAA